MIDHRLVVFEPVAKDLVRRLEMYSGRIEAVLGTAPPVTPPDIGELVESKLIQCEGCDAGVALLIFAPSATDLGRFEDYARRMYQQVVQMNVPSYIIGPALGDGPLMDRPADILKIWPEREAMQRLRPDEFNPLLDELARAHGADGSAHQALERLREAGELPYRGTRRHRGNLCPKCFFYRRVSDADEACDAYEKWLVDPPVKREQCEQFISR
jgi:hypothetical protein